LEEKDTIRSICLSKDGRYLLSNTSDKTPTIYLWDLFKREKVNKYRGHKQDMNIIECAFGGVNETMVICGSECGSVFIWNKVKGDLLAKLSGHN
jgi:WD40 repeat protein